MATRRDPDPEWVAWVCTTCRLRVELAPGAQPLGHVCKPRRSHVYPLMRERDLQQQLELTPTS